MAAQVEEERRESRIDQMFGDDGVARRVFAAAETVDEDDAGERGRSTREQQATRKAYPFALQHEAAPCAQAGYGLGFLVHGRGPDAQRYRTAGRLPGIRAERTWQTRSECLIVISQEHTRRCLRVLPRRLVTVGAGASRRSRSARMDGTHD